MSSKPNAGTLWRWLDRAVEHGLAIRIGKGTKKEPYRFGLNGRNGAGPSDEMSR